MDPSCTSFGELLFENIVQKKIFCCFRVEIFIPLGLVEKVTYEFGNIGRVFFFFFSVSAIRTSLYFDSIVNICYLPSGRSVLGKTVPEVLSCLFFSSRLL